MVFTEEDRILIKILRQKKGYGAKRLLQEFCGKPWSRSALNRLLQQIDETGSADRKTGSGRPKTARTSNNVEVVEELVLSQEDAPGTHLTVRQIMRETGSHRASVHRIIHSDLKLQCFKKRRAQLLTEANKDKRLACAKQLLKKYPEHAVSFILVYRRKTVYSSTAS